MGSVRRSERFVAALLLAAATLPQAARADVFCCENDVGRQVCADVLPQVCYGRAYRVLNSQGMVVREVGLPLTREQLLEQREEEKRKRVEADRVRAQKQRERALLETYQGLDDITTQEARAIAEVEVDIQKAKAAEEDLLKQRARLAREKEFYVGRSMPEDLKKQLRENEQEILGQRSVIDAKQKHIEAIRQRYADDRKEYQAILDRRDAIYRR